MTKILINIIFFILFILIIIGFIYIYMNVWHFDLASIQKAVQTELTEFYFPNE
jgi:uncharacterized membrane protein YdjX (TVP38/TMEM64 family)